MQLRTADFFAPTTKLNGNMREVRRLLKCHLLKEAAGLFAILVPDSFFYFYYYCLEKKRNAALF